MKKFKIAFDLNGNDNGIKAGLVASKNFLEQNNNFHIYLLGNEEEIKNFYNNNLPNNLTIVNNSLVSQDKKNLRKALHENTSMNVAIDLLANNEVNAVLSSGDSGLYLSAATLKLKRLQGVSRPAFMPVMPTIKGKKFLLLDVGANIETKADYLVEWAKIANVFAKKILNVLEPKIALLNIGTEDYKGIDIIKEANYLLKNEEQINYLGFVETRDILNYTCDVALIDGYGGNLVLKSLEGAILSFKDLLKNKIKTKFIRKIGYLFLKGAFKDVAETLDYRNVGAAWVIGVNGVIIKSHGSSDNKAYLGALNQIKIALENNILENVKKELNIND
ncbi:phosphate acyltransferase PlsX [Mycoplasma sp. 1018B]|uniref:phosphate acyltransferase PlsX n=1 Tax=Mycoplasma sp. 1018B TaxID=2967302 RepID=UPI00211BAAFB|nr:phosphate acyltransferase PlsX [Mycoplasma sp. 1018B]UUM19289.1 phosphate acyltransferase PlsX [Mycoplasma sp. 1018B]